jgi:aspartate carbamoyltransferase catalytic subunit
VKKLPTLRGRTVVNLFYESSTRTLASFELAAKRLSADTMSLRSAGSSADKGESLKDTALTLAAYDPDVIVVRHPSIGAPRLVARYTGAHVVNAGDGKHQHPTQALLDLYTIRQEFTRLGRKLDGAQVALVGDLKHGRTVHSLIKLLSLYKGLTFSLVAPASLEMPGVLVSLARERGHRVRESTSLEDGVRKPHILYATRIQKERMSGEGLESYPSSFRIDRAAVKALCAKDTVILHPLPRDSTPGANDLAADLDRDPRLAIFRQTDNGIPVRMAIFAILLGVERLVAKDLRDAPWISPARLGPMDRNK